MLGDDLVGAVEGALGVRVVVAPDHGGHAGDVPGLDRHRVIGELDVELPPHVVGRLERVGPLVVDVEQAAHGRLLVGRLVVLPEAEPPLRVLAGAAAPRLVHERHVRHQPAGAELDQGELQARVPLGNPAADEVGHDLRRAGGRGVPAAHGAAGHHVVGQLALAHVHRGHHALDRASGLGRVFLDHDPAGGDVEEDRQAVRLGAVPDRLVPARPVRLRRDFRDHDRLQAELDRPLDLGHRVGDVGQRDGRDRAHPVLVLKVRLGDPGVPRPRVGDGELVVVGEQHEQRQVGEVHGGVDALHVHVGQDVLRNPARRGAVVALELAVLGHRPAVEADGVQLPELGVAALDDRLLEGELLFPERAVAHVGREPGLEQVRRLDDVAVPRDEELFVLGHRQVSPSSQLPGYQIVGLPCINLVVTPGAGQR